MGSLGFTAGLVVGGLLGVAVLSALSSRDGAPSPAERCLQRGQSALLAARARVRQAVAAARQAKLDTTASLQAEWERAKRGGAQR
jgi:hypothetical protein